MEEFRNGLDIPVGVTDIDVAEVGRELRQFPPHVETRAIPADEPAGRETVTKILKPRPTTDTPASRWRSQADGTGYCGERTTDARDPPAVWPRSDTRNASVADRRTEVIALLCIVRKGRTRRILDWDEAGFSELCLANREDTTLKIHIRPIESQSLPWPEAVALRSPMRVTYVIALNPVGEVSRAASAINRSISCSVKMCGLLRRRRAASRRRGGTSVRGSSVLSQEANPLTMLEPPSPMSHVAHVAAPLPNGGQVLR